MGLCSTATLAWGFVIPEDKLHNLLRVFRTHREENKAKPDDEAESDDESEPDDDFEPDDDSEPDENTVPEGPPKKKKKTEPFEFEQASKLEKYIEKAMKKSQAARYFTFVPGGIDHEEGDVERNITLSFYYCGGETHEVDRWGRENCEWIQAECEFTPGVC